MLTGIYYMLMAELPVHFDQRPIVVVMGVSGSGKSTVGLALAQHLELPFLDADDFHPQSNIDKMSRGAPLNDEDRWPWLQSLSQAMKGESERTDGVVATCSALKRSYRQYILQQVGKPMVFILLDGDRDTLYHRMTKRSDHYMPPDLLDSQLADLEYPDSDEPVMTCSILNSIDSLVSEITASLGTEKQDPSPVDL